jgi:hypothetical protein
MTCRSAAAVVLVSSHFLLLSRCVPAVRGLPAKIAVHSNKAICPQDPGTRSPAELTIAARSSAYAVVRDEVVERKVTFLRDSQQFVPPEQRLSDAELEKQIAAVERDPPEGVLFSISKERELVFFSGPVATDTGNLSESRWGILTMRYGCTWHKLEHFFDGSDIQTYRTPQGVPIVVHTAATGQCEDTVSVLSLVDVRHVHEKRFAVERASMTDVCSSQDPDEAKVHISVELNKIGDELKGLTVTKREPQQKELREVYVFDSQSKLVAVPHE